MKLKSRPRSIRSAVAVANAVRRSKLFKARPEAPAKSEKEIRREALYSLLSPKRAIPDGLIWFALFSKPASMRDKSPEHHLAKWIEANCNAFTLTQVEKRRINGSRGADTIFRDYPLLPGVIFAGFSRPPDWYYIETCRNFREPVEMIPGEPCIVPEREIRRFSDTVEASKMIVEAKSLQAGDSAKIVSGPFSGWLVKIMAVLSGGRYETAIANSKIQISAAQVQAA